MKMSDAPQKKVDELWKEQVEREKHAAPTPSGATPPPAPPSEPPSSSAPSAPSGTEGPAAPTGEPSEWPEARFDIFVSSLAMDTLIALGDAPHPGTRRHTVNLPQARYVIDLLGLLEEKTRGNLSVDEARLLKDTLYQLRMRYLAKSGTSAT